MEPERLFAESWSLGRHPTSASSEWLGEVSSHMIQLSSWSIQLIVQIQIPSAPSGTWTVIFTQRDRTQDSNLQDANDLGCNDVYIYGVLYPNIENQYSCIFMALSPSKYYSPLSKTASGHKLAQIWLTYASSFDLPLLERVWVEVDRVCLHHHIPTVHPMQWHSYE